MDGKKKRFEFSKIMALIAVSMWLLVNLFGLVMMVVMMDTSPLMYVVPSVDAVIAVVLACYYHKARLENQIKLKRYYGDDASFVMKNNHDTWDQEINGGM